MLTLYSQEQATKMMIASQKREARAEGKAEGKVEGILDLLSRYMKRHGCDAETAMDELEIAAAERAELRPRLAEFTR